MAASLEDWKALVEKEGTPLDKLVLQTAEGIAVQPLYTAGPAPAVRPGTGSFGVCVCSDAAHVADDLDGGADAVWLDSNDRDAARAVRQRGAHLVTELYGGGPPPDDDEPDDGDASTGAAWLGFDFIGAAVVGAIEPRTLSDAFLRGLTPMAEHLGDARTRTVRVSGLPFHDRGADAADELALMLASTVADLRALTHDGRLDSERAAGQLWFQIAVGRDTFGELCKLRALRVLAAKVFGAAGITGAPPPIHAVCSGRTQSQRDPWVNMLRVTTEVFAAALGGADLVTPLPFDAAIGASSAHARRVARNTALVLREESHLGRVVDAAGGSYYIESRTDALAREAWARFTRLERDGGIVKLIASEQLAARLDTAWSKRAAAIAKRKEPVLGVSEFANLDEQLPATTGAAPRGHRDGEAFEALRARVEQAPAKRVLLVTLGPASEHRARVGFASALFATAGLRATEATLAEALAAKPDIACLCGSDERYAAEAVAAATQLREIGAIKIVLAGRPGALEPALKAAGVRAFVFIGADVVATLTELVS